MHWGLATRLGVGNGIDPGHGKWMYLMPYSALPKSPDGLTVEARYFSTQ
jgi:hypothetical protein